MNEFSKEEPQLASRFSTRALLNAALRIVVWLFVLVGGLLFLIPEFKKMFEEFGIALPVLSQWVISLSDKAIKLSFVFLPFVFLAIIMAELGLLSIPRGAIRGILNKLAWLVLLLAIILLAVAFCIPLIQIMEGLTGSKKG
jgi:hypothetical protein